MKQSLRIGHQFGRGSAFDAERLAGRVAGVRLLRNQHAVFDDADGSASGATEGTEAWDLFSHSPKAGTAAVPV